MTEPLSRRAVLIGGGALALMTACGKKGDDIKVGNTDTTAANKDELSIVQAGFGFQTGIDERVTFAVFQGVPASLYDGNDPVMVAFQRPGGSVLSEPVVAVRKDGVPDHPYFLAHHDFDVPGNWALQVTVKNKQPGRLVIPVIDPTKAAWPVPGGPLPKVATPTPTNTMDVNPICTRTPEACAFHDHSLDTLLGNGKPTVVILSTPARCQSATCGPVLESIISETAEARDRLNIVHVEVYTDDSLKLSPAFEAFKTDSEPTAYFADKNGIVTERFDGPFDQTEAHEAIARLLA